MFMAQVGHESGGFLYRAENLNYSADALMRIFPKYFPDQENAQKYARQPEKIASRAYANRLGNGPEETQDGWKFRGRGFIQITGRSNYLGAAKALGIPFDDLPDYLQSIPGAMRSAGWFWSSINGNQCADERDIITCTRRINGGLNGLADRQTIYTRAEEVMGE
jgi:putative chitinase